MAQRRVTDLTASEVRSAVAERFGDVAAHPKGEFSFPVGRAFAEALGYPADVLAGLPTGAVASFAGATCLAPWYDAWVGLTVADLGCGAGTDTLLLSEAVGQQGLVVGVDLCRQMGALARDNARSAGAPHVSICCAPVEALPLRPESVDIAVANGVFNLSPEKAQAVGEVFRVLKRGGVLLGAEIVLQWELPAGQGDGLEDWFR